MACSAMAVEFRAPLGTFRLRAACHQCLYLACHAAIPTNPLVITVFPDGTILFIGYKTFAFNNETRVLRMTALFPRYLPQILDLNVYSIIFRIKRSNYREIFYNWFLFIEKDYTNFEPKFSFYSHS